MGEMATDMQRLYDDDFYAWTQLQARALRRFAGTRPNLALDLPHLAEEIRDLGKEQRNAVRSWTRHILVHLLLLQFSPATAPRAGWRSEIALARADLADRLTGTLRRDLERRLPKLYEQARDVAAAKLEEHGENAILPDACPFTLGDLLQRNWFPPTPEKV